MFKNFEHKVLIVLVLVPLSSVLFATWNVTVSSPTGRDLIAQQYGTSTSFCTTMSPVLVPLSRYLVQVPVVCKTFFYCMVLRDSPLLCRSTSLHVHVYLLIPFPYSRTLLLQ
jgi:hypothetical protein